MHADHIIVVFVISQYYTNDIVVVSVVSTSMTLEFQLRQCRISTGIKVSVEIEKTYTNYKIKHYRKIKMVKPSGYRTPVPFRKRKRRRIEVTYANHYTNEHNET